MCAFLFEEKRALLDGAGQGTRRRKATPVQFKSSRKLRVVFFFFCGFVQAEFANEEFTMRL